MTEARIYRPAKTAMQSGRAKTRKWVLEFEPAAAKIVDPLMGWTGSADTREQVHMTFDSRDEAVAFAEKNGLEFRVEEPKTRRIRPKNYADNFR
ncbi:MAG: ETC complex I subunit [Rhodospirillales bacterium]